MHCIALRCVALALHCMHCVTLHFLALPTWLRFGAGEAILIAVDARSNYYCLWEQTINQVRPLQAACPCPTVSAQHTTQLNYSETFVPCSPGAQARPLVPFNTLPARWALPDVAAAAAADRPKNKQVQIKKTFILLVHVFNCLAVRCLAEDGAVLSAPICVQNLESREIHVRSSSCDGRSTTRCRRI